MKIEASARRVRCLPLEAIQRIESSWTIVSVKRDYPHTYDEVNSNKQDNKAKVIFRDDD